MRKPNYKQVYKHCESAEERAAYASKAFDELRNALRAAGLWAAPMTATLDLLVRDRTEYEFLYPDVMINGPVKKSDKGNDYFSYEWSALRKLEDAILKREKALGLLELPAQPAAALQKSAADEFLTAH